MKRTNTFAVRPLTDDDEQVLRDLLDASAALWNEINYQRLMRYNDEDGFKDEDVWDADTGALEGNTKTFSARPPPKLSGEQTPKHGAGSSRTRKRTTTSRTRRLPNTRNRRDSVVLEIGDFQWSANRRFASTTKTTDVFSRASSERTHTPSNGATAPDLRLS